VFYDFIVHNENKKPILVIDQPEDNISNTKILNSLVKKLSLLRDKRQIILVTHNPILVVNLDADNVIHLENINGKLNTQAGCLEADGIIPLIAKTMDGGVEAIERRFKIYGRK
jgi:predicted ATPase